MEFSMILCRFFNTAPVFLPYRIKILFYHIVFYYVLFNVLDAATQQFLNF